MRFERPHLVIALALAACSSAPPPRPRALHDVLPEGAIAQTGSFVLYSRFEPNLYDRLRRWAVESEDDRGETGCVDELGEEDHAAWIAAVETLRTLLAQDRMELRLHYDVAGIEVEGMEPGPAEYHQALARAAVIYRACFWEQDDRSNRAWIRALVTLLERAEDPMRTRIAQAHGATWPDERIPVDVVPWVNFGGGNTVVHPNHTFISSTQPGYDGFGALEVIFHEASHTFVGPHSEGAIAVLREAAAQRGVQLPEDFWHAVLFATAGWIARKTIRELWNQAYVPYMDAQGVMNRAWPTLRAPLERAWLPYCEGRSTLEEAAAALVQGMQEEDEDH